MDGTAKLPKTKPNRKILTIPSPRRKMQRRTHGGREDRRWIEYYSHKPTNSKLGIQNEWSIMHHHFGLLTADIEVAPHVKWDIFLGLSNIMSECSVCVKMSRVFLVSLTGDTLHCTTCYLVLANCSMLCIQRMILSLSRPLAINLLTLSILKLHYYHTVLRLPYYRRILTIPRHCQFVQCHRLTVATSSNVANIPRLIFYHGCYYSQWYNCFGTYPWCASRGTTNLFNWYLYS
jgi:hypothetical protein